MSAYPKSKRDELYESIRHHRENIGRALVEMDETVVVTRELIEASRVSLCTADRLLEVTDRLFGTGIASSPARDEVTKAAEHRRQAAACVAVADRMSLESERAMMLEMANRFLELAHQVEAESA